MRATGGEHPAARGWPGARAPVPLCTAEAHGLTLWFAGEGPDAFGFERTRGKGAEAAWSDWARSPERGPGDLSSSPALSFDLYIFWQGPALSGCQLPQCYP